MFAHTTPLHILLVVYFFYASDGIQFDIVSGKSRCVKEDFHPGQIIHGTYSLSVVNPTSTTSNYNHLKMNVQIRGPTDPDGTSSIIIEKDDVSLEERPFAFTVSDEGTHTFCFADRPRTAAVGVPLVRRIKLKYDEKFIEPEKANLLSLDDLSPVDRLLYRVEEHLFRLKDEFVFMREREMAHRDTNESTNARIPSLSGITIFLLIVCGLWQVFYLRNYFMKKKLL